MLARSCTSCRADKKGCDRQRPCERCGKRALTAAERIEAPAPASGAQPTSKKRAAPSSAARPASKRAKKQAGESDSGEVAAGESGKNGEGEEEAGEDEEDLEGGEEDVAGDDQPEVKLIWEEGDAGVVYDTEVSGDEEEDTTPADGGDAVDEQEDAGPSGENGGDGIPYYPTPTYSTLANRGFRIPVKTRESVADLPEQNE